MKYTLAFHLGQKVRESALSCIVTTTGFDFSVTCLTFRSDRNDILISGSSGIADDQGDHR